MNVLLSVSRKIEHFDLSQDGRFRNWLAQIARNAAIDQLRRRNKSAVGGSDFLRRMSEQPAAASEGKMFDTEARRQQFLWAADQVRHQVSQSTWQAFG